MSVVMRDNGLIILICLSSFDNKVMLASQNELGNISSASIL